MVNFMLKQFGERALRPYFFPRSGSILIRDLHPFMAPDLHHDLRKGKTIIPQTEFLAAPFRDDGITKRAEPARIDEDDPHVCTDLGRRNPSAEPLARTKIIKRVFEVSDDGARRRRRKILHTPGFCPEDRISEQQNFFDSHVISERYDR